MRSGFVERKGKIVELDRSFDLEFWQSQTAQARCDAAWELVLHAWRVKGNDVRQLRLLRRRLLLPDGGTTYSSRYSQGYTRGRF
jgi:hypothetical protein